MASEPKPTTAAIVDGLALWEEHRPQTGEDWLAVAQRFIAQQGDASQSSPVFAGLVLATERGNAQEMRATMAEEALAAVTAERDAARADVAALLEAIDAHDRDKTGAWATDDLDQALHDTASKIRERTSDARRLAEAAIPERKLREWVETRAVASGDADRGYANALNDLSGLLDGLGPQPS
jgi:hypothetical protein